MNVTLPAIGDEKLPLVIQLHGWGGSKGGLSQSLEWAQNGYAVLNYTARGFGESCGTSSSRSADPVGCAEGWIHLADSRYEVRDSQYLAGLLVDQGIVHPRKIAATGVSYGGGQSLQLATLRKYMRLEDGTLTRWRSPGGRRMKLAAAAPIIPWSDLSAALLPNSRTLDYVLTGPTDNFTPIGVMKQSWVAALYAAGAALGFYSAPGVDPGADIQTWYSVIQAGEPYDPMVAGPIVQEVTSNHSAFYLPAKRRPAPTLISNGFTDDLFPVNEALRWADRFRNRGPIAQFHYDSGHSRGQNKGADTALHNARIHDWFDRYVKRDRSATPMEGVEALTQTCGGPSAGPFSAPTWRELHPGEVRHVEAPVKTILSSADTLGATVDPIAVGANCVTTSAADQAGTATYRLPAATIDGYTLLGHPTVIADLVVTGAAPTDTELAARLWDVAPGDTQ